LKKAAIITAFEPSQFRGGIETYTTQLVDLLRSRGVKTDIYHTGMIGEDHGFHNDYLGKLYLTGKKVISSGEAYDMVIANAFYGLGFFPPKTKTFNIFHLTHAGFAEEIKEIVPRRQYLEWKFLWGEFCESVSGFNRTKIAVSESVREELRRFYGFFDVSLIPNFVDTDVFVRCDRVSSRKKWGIPDEAFVGLYVGRWDILKRCDITERVVREKPDVYWLVVLGTGSDETAVPRSENVKVIGQVEHKSMNTIYSAADFMLFPSSYEGFGYVIIEAMACELPVITSNVGIAKTLYKDEPFLDLLLPDFTVGSRGIVLSAIEKMEYLRSHRGRAEIMAAEGRRIIEQEFGKEEWKKRMLRVLEL